MDDGTGIKIDNTIFSVVFNADKNPGPRQDAQNINNLISEAQNELGFSLDYRITTSCNELTLSDSN